MSVYFDWSVAIVEVLLSEKNVSCLFLAYFMYYAVVNNCIFEPMYPYYVRILLPGVFGGVYGAS